MTARQRALVGGAVALGIVLAAFWFLHLRAAREPGEFRAELKAMLSPPSPLRPQVATPFWAVEQTGDHYTGTPIQLLTYITIEKARPGASAVRMLALAASAAETGPWRDLCPVGLAERRLAYRSGQAQIVFLDRGITAEQNLLGHEIEPQTPVSSWSAWSCRETCETAYLRLAVIDDRGRRSTTVLRTAESRNEDAGPGAHFKVEGGEIHLLVPIEVAPACN